MDEADRKRYLEEYTEKIKAVGDIRMQQVYDEFNGFNERAPTRCLTHREESRARKGHCHRTSRGRESWTGAFVYGPLHKGLCLYVGKNIPQETIDQLTRDYGQILVVISTPSGN